MNGHERAISKSKAMKLNRQDSEKSELLTRSKEADPSNLLSQPQSFRNTDNAGSAPEIENAGSILEAIVNSSEDAIVSKTLDGIITSWNAGAEKIFGYSASEAIGNHISFIIPKELHQEEQMVINKIKKGEQVLHFETVRLTKGGKNINISLTVSPVRDQTGRITGASKIARDITSQKQAQEILAKSEQALKESAQRLEDFIKIASHELKTPITTIKGYLQLLLRSANEEEQIPPHFIKSSLGIMNKQVERLARLIGELLDMSKIESEVVALNKESFSLNELVNEAVQDLRYIYKENEINISHEFECNLFADKDRISQVITNLVTNAIKYSPNREKIEIKLFRDSTDVVAVSITDQGIGIETKDHQKIFERFYRTEGTYQQTYPGFGLGLYIVSEILSRHNGTISVQSEKGKGSTFTFKLPLE